MKKIICIIAAVLACSMLLTGCSKSEDKVESGTVKVDELAQYLIDNLEFTHELSAVDEETATELYKLDMTVIQNMTIYTSGDDSAEEIAVFEATDVAGASDVKDRIIRRVETRREDFSDYLPDEYKKLEAPAFVAYDKYVVLCVSGDNQAAVAAIQEYLGKD